MVPRLVACVSVKPSSGRSQPAGRPERGRPTSARAGGRELRLERSKTWWAERVRDVKADGSRPADGAGPSAGDAPAVTLPPVGTGRSEPTIRDVAVRAGVSKSLVSLVL